MTAPLTQMRRVALQTCFVITSIFLSTFAAHSQGIYSSHPTGYQKDDERLCAAGAERAAEDFCLAFHDYKLSEHVNPTEAAAARNKMLFVLKREIDDYYDGYKHGNVKKTKWFQTVLDILGIGLAFTGTIVNGERQKTVLGATSGSFLAGRKAIDDRFELLQQKILINTMEANRLNAWAEIMDDMKKPIGEFTWDSGREKLQRYAFRGTFDDAINSLVDKTGTDVSDATAKVAIAGAVRKSELDNLLDNYKSSIKPLWEKSTKDDQDIATLAAVAAPTATQTQQLADLRTEKANLLANEQKIWDGIVASGSLDAIEKKMNAKYSAAPAVLAGYAAAKGRITSVPPTATQDDYYFVFSKMNAVVGGDADLNKIFSEILKKNTP